MYLENTSSCNGSEIRNILKRQTPIKYIIDGFKNKLKHYNFQV